MAWAPDLYLKFEQERNQPCLDLLSRLARMNRTYSNILDLGCGPGNSTEQLLKHYEQATVIGLDADDNMLAKARASHPKVRFVKGVAPVALSQLSEKFDLVFSNACIHWVEDQEALIDEVYGVLHAQGVFAAQIPLTDESPFYRILYGLIARKWTKLKSVNHFHNLNQEGYYNVLRKQFKRVTLWQSDYYHVVAPNAVLEWYCGSGLRPYLALLDEAEQTEFLNDLQKEIDAQYPLLEDRNVFLIMPRLFFIAEK